MLNDTVLQPGLNRKLPVGAAAKLSTFDREKFSFTKPIITIPAGDYKLLITHDDYIPCKQTLTAESGKQLEQSIQLSHTELYNNREGFARFEAEKTKVLNTRKGLSAGIIRYDYIIPGSCCRRNYCRCIRNTYSK